uniref:Ig-like domain-containing protein n=1 Tax=Castor canadensis TaxID=51338 RepID=A0A8C0ZNQ7_CASCN
MRFLTQFLGLLMLCIPGYSGDVVLTQTLLSLSVTPGELASISCKSSQSLLKHLPWYLQKSGKDSKSLVYHANSLESGVPSRFNDSGSRTDFTVSSNSLEPEDVATYYCQHYYDIPPSVIQVRT